MPSYPLMYRLGMTPWERYGQAASASIAAVLDRERAEADDPPGRALDLGCGRAQFTPELVRRGWSAVGVDIVPAAIEGARRKDPDGGRYEVADVTDLDPHLGQFDLFLDIGCFQGFEAPERAAVGRSVTERAAPRARVLMLAFGRTRLRSMIGGVSEEQVSEAFPGWRLTSSEPAETAGLGWPMNRTRPRWYRLQRS
ncbi:class I SAM-dependent methyltransferase [Ruania zhangjianzhongii]|uniref:class I SAM-dependent methyltransferase n=1 Tax=Ruania zhangjianzhongii TaxID=2603206 RepID=UPI001AEFA526|nr:class I SAM-dependent methyltransferase [Ruania zhangjianzhongii]